MRNPEGAAIPFDVCDVEIDIDLLRRLWLFNPIAWVPRLGNWWFDLAVKRLVCRLDSGGVYYEGGVVYYQKKHLPYSAIRNVAVGQGPLEQWLGARHIKVETSGQASGWPEVVIPCAANPDPTAAEVMKRVTMARGEPLTAISVD